MKQKSTMGRWKMRKLIKGMRASRTTSYTAKQYFAYPPITGWVGGPDTVLNGAKRK